MSEGAAPPASPRPLGAVWLTLGAWALLSLVLAALAPVAGITLALALGTTLGLGVAGAAGARGVPPPAEARMGLHGFAPRFLAIVLLLLPAALLSSELDNWVAAALERPEPVGAESPGSPAASPGAEGEPAQGMAEPTEEPSPPPLPDWLTAAEWALFAVALRPLLEEFFFRGVVQQGMVAHLGALRGLVFTALLFAALRASLGLGSAYGFATLGAQALLEGLLLGLVRLASGSILPGVVLQGGLAALGLASLVLADTLPIAGFNAEGDHTPLAILLPCALCVALGVGLAWRRLGSAPRVPPAVEEQARPD